MAAGRDPAPPGTIAPDDPIAATFSAAMAEYSRVLCGQIRAASEVSHEAATTWVEGAGALVAAVDALRDRARAVAAGAGAENAPDGAGADPRDAALLTVIDAFAEQALARLLALIAEGQRHDKASQMLDALDEMAGGLAQLDLPAITASQHGATLPVRLIEQAEQGFVMAEQRRALATARGNPADTGGAPDPVELF
ncbi:hypothetical protein [Rhodovulum marinum]|nr:hypothetical protein [Rhodovulum marinum]